jgi:hypothetical protein
MLDGVDLGNRGLGMERELQTNFLEIRSWNLRNSTVLAR